MSESNEQKKENKNQPRRQKAYEILHLLCGRVLQFNDEKKTKGVYGINNISLVRGRASISVEELKILGFDDELIDFLILQLTKPRN